MAANYDKKVELIGMAVHIVFNKTANRIICLNFYNIAHDFELLLSTDIFKMTLRGPSILLLSSLLFWGGSAFSQITADASRSGTTTYKTDSIANDPIFIYYSDPRGFNTSGTLTAAVPDSNNLTFKWFKYNERTSDFDIALKTEIGVTESIKDNCTQGGYMVAINNEKNDWDTAFYAWVFQNEFNVSAINVYNSTCELMELHTTMAYDEEFEYYDRVSGKPLTYFSDNIKYMKYRWEATPRGASIPSVKNPVFEAPTKPTVYKLTVEDSHGESRTKKLEIEEGDDNGDGNLYLKAVKAKFTASRSFVPAEETDSSGQAPLFVQFTDSSENATEWCWYFYKPIDQRIVEVDTLMTDSITTQILPDSILYRTPNNKYGYDVALSVKGPVYMLNGEQHQCTDRLLKEEYINVDSSFIAKNPDIPNAFTPGGANPVFKFTDETMPKSIRRFEIKIYDRWGMRIYSYEDNNGSWEGWDGKTFGFGDAPAGVYFYTIYAEGWNNETFRRKGYVHLFREKGF